MEFKEQADAEEALKACHGMDFGGSRIAGTIIFLEFQPNCDLVEFAKGPKKDTHGCFTCGDESHWSRDCPRKRRSSHYDRRRSPPYRRERDYERRRSRSRSPERRRERDYSPRREREYSPDRRRERDYSPKRSRGDSPYEYIYSITL